MRFAFKWPLLFVLLMTAAFAETKPESDELLMAVRSLIKSAGGMLPLSDLLVTLEKGGRKVGESTLSRHLGRWVKGGMLICDHQGKRNVYGLPAGGVMSSGEVGVVSISSS